MTSSTTVAITAAQTLYAQWTANTYIVTFDANGGEAPSPASKSVTYDSTYGTLATTSRTGYAFNGWFTAASGGTAVTSTTTVAFTADQTLYAQWTANTYTVSFDANGGDTPSPTGKSVTYDGTYDTLAITSRTGYTFNGWFTAASGGTEVTSTTTVAITADQTLYAQWTANTYIVSFDANGGEAPSPASKSVTYDSTYGTLATVSRTGYAFNGWFTAASEGSQVTSITAVAITAAQTLYAQWIQNGVLALTSGDLTSSGTSGGPFSLSSKDYTLQNTGGESIDWTVAKTAEWVNLSATSGTLAAGASATVTISINATADSLVVGSYNDTVTFTNTTNGTGDTTRGVALTVLTVYQGWANGFLPAADVSDPAGNNDGDSLTNFQEYAFGTDPTFSSSNPIAYAPGEDVTSPGSPMPLNLAGGGGLDFRAVFGRRKNHVAAGLTYTVQFSAGLDVWVTSTAPPTVLTGENSAGEIEAIGVPFPDFIPVPSGLQKPTFFRVGVSGN